MTLRSGMNGAAKKITIKLDTIIVAPDYDPLADKRPYVKSHMNPRMLAYFYKRLKDDKKSITAEIAKLREQMVAPSYTGDEADSASETMNHEIASAQIRTLLLRQDAVHSHLIEMDQNGTKSNYGYCEESGNEIGVKRLYKTPHARFTVEVQQELERDEKQRNARGCRLSELEKPLPRNPMARIFAT